MSEEKKSSESGRKINSISSLQQQGQELLARVNSTVDIGTAYLLFLDPTGQDFTILSVGSETGDSHPLPVVKLSGHNPVIEHLKLEKKALTRDSLKTLSRLIERWQQDAAVAALEKIELFIPLLSSERLIGILALGKKKEGDYTPDDVLLLCNLTGQASVSLEREYLIEQLEKRTEELTILNRAGTIITSSLDIQSVFDDFINELRRRVDIAWAAIVLADNGNLRFLALSSRVKSVWQVGEQLPLKGTTTEWVITSRETVFEPDLSKEKRFSTARPLLEQGLRSIVYLPLVTRDRAIGNLVIGSQTPQAYQSSDITFLEQVAAQIAAPVENTQLYAEVEEKSRVDDLTGLLNRRSLDEFIVSEINRHSRYGGIFSLISLDVDALKAINDHHGHLAGDSVLKQVGRILTSSIRSADQAFRYGGDEFAILLPNTSSDDAGMVAERIRKQISSAVIIDGIRITVSIGIASWPANGKEVNEIIASADEALYQAKRSGGDRIHKIASNGKSETG